MLPSSNQVFAYQRCLKQHSGTRWRPLVEARPHAECCCVPAANIHHGATSHNPRPQVFDSCFNTAIPPLGVYFEVLSDVCPESPQSILRSVPIIVRVRRGVVYSLDGDFLQLKQDTEKASQTNKTSVGVLDRLRTSSVNARQFG